VAAGQADHPAHDQPLQRRHRRPDRQLTPAQERLTAVFVGTWNTTLCTSAKAHGFSCADIATAFNGPDGLRPSGDLLAVDYTHPSDKGNEVIARVLADLGYAPLA